MIAVAAARYWISIIIIIITIIITVVFFISVSIGFNSFAKRKFIAIKAFARRDSVHPDIWRFINHLLTYIILETKKTVIVLAFETWERYKEKAIVPYNFNVHKITSNLYFMQNTVYTVW